MKVGCCFRGWLRDSHSEEGVFEQEFENVIRKQAIRIYEGKAFLRYRAQQIHSLQMRNFIIHPPLIRIRQILT